MTYNQETTPKTGAVVHRGSVSAVRKSGRCLILSHKILAVIEEDRCVYQCRKPRRGFNRDNALCATVGTFTRSKRTAR